MSRGVLRLLGGLGSIALAAALLGGAPAVAQGTAAAGITFVAPSTLYDAIARGHAITLTAYTLTERGEMAVALERAGDRLARDHSGFVNVMLDGQAFGFAQQQNARVAAELRAHHVGVLFTQGALHAKFVTVDRVLMLSDRNYSGDGLVVRDENPDDRRVVSGALGFCPGSRGSDPLLRASSARCPVSLLANDHFWTRKGDSLVAEAEVILSQPGDVFMESESFGSGNAVYNALLLRAMSGGHVRLIVSGLEYRQQRTYSSQSRRSNYSTRYGNYPSYATRRAYGSSYGGYGGSSYGGYGGSSYGGYGGSSYGGYGGYGGSSYGGSPYGYGGGSESEQAAIARLQAAGVDVRVGSANGSTNEKLLRVGRTVFIGSTNATRGVADQADWGMVLTDDRLSSAVQARLDAHWQAAAPP